MSGSRCDAGQPSTLKEATHSAGELTRLAAARSGRTSHSSGGRSSQDVAGPSNAGGGAPTVVQPLAGDAAPGAQPAVDAAPRRALSPSLSCLHGGKRAKHTRNGSAHKVTLCGAFPEAVEEDQ